MGVSGGSPPLEPKKASKDWGMEQALSLWNGLYYKFSPSINGSVVLDLGCSWGYFLMFLHENFSPRGTIGVDVSPLWKSVDHGWDYFSLLESGKLSFFDGYLSEISSIETESVDYIFSTSVLQYIRPEELLTTLEKSFALLRPGGEMILRTRCFASYIGQDLHSHYDLHYMHLFHPLRTIKNDLLNWKNREARYLNFLTASNYLLYFYSAGFEVVEFNKRRSTHSPELLDKLLQLYPWVAEDDLMTAELEVRLFKPYGLQQYKLLGDASSTLPKA